jgi:ribosomal protein L35AE/L33A
MRGRGPNAAVYFAKLSCIAARKSGTTVGGRITRAATRRGIARLCRKSMTKSCGPCITIVPVLKTPSPTFSGTRAVAGWCWTSWW